MKITFVGCSFTVGEGLDLKKDDLNNYANIVANRYSAEANNLAEIGNSNYNIFISAINEILVNAPDKIVIQWSGLNRLWLYPGPDTELTLSKIINRGYDYRDISYTKKQLQKFSDMYQILNHDYMNIVTLVNYCNILTKINKGKTIFVNGLIPWTSDIDNKDSITDFSKNLSNYTKEILDFNNRSDAELNRFFFRLHDTIATLDKSQWVNLFNSMSEIQVDYGNDNLHPGPKSHKLYADMIINYIENNND